MDVFVLAAHIATLLLHARSAGIDSEELLAGTDVDTSLLADPTAPVPLAVFEQVCGRCERITGDPLFAAHAALASAGDEYGMGRHAITSLPNARATFREGTKLLEQMANPLAARFVEKAPGGGMVLTPIPDAPPGVETYAEFLLAVVLLTMRASTMVPVVPHEVRLRHAPRTDEETYREAFECPVRFATADSAIVFPDAVLDLPNSSPDANLARLLTADVLRQTRAHYSEGMDLVGLVQVTLNAAESVEDWHLKTVAARCRLPARSLQHKLKQSGTSFLALADATRRGKAVQYLAENLSQDEVSYRLGYADTGSFRKAFHRWYAVAPGMWKNPQHRESGARPDS